MRTRLILSTLILVAVSACGAGSTNVAASRSAGPAPHVALVETDRGIAGAVVRGGHARVVWRRADAVVAADGSAAVARADDGRLIRLDPESGSALQSWTMAAGLRPVLVEPGGARVVLSDRPTTTDSWTTSRASTHLVLMNTQTGASVDRVVAADWEPEALQPKHPVVFGLDHHADHYFVQQLDLTTGARNAVIDQDKEPGGEMRGHPIHGVMDLDHSMLATLYVNADNATKPAFVHILFLTGWSYCVDLPREFASGAPGSQSIERDNHDVLTVRAAAADRRATFDLGSFASASGPAQVQLLPHAGTAADQPYRSIPGFVALIG